MTVRNEIAAPAGVSVRRLTAEVPLAWVHVSVVFSVLAAITIIKPVDPDFWWHLATGEQILDSGIPREDPFSWTAAGRPWIAHEWLSELIIACVQSTFGYGGNLALFIACGVAPFVLMYALARRWGAHRLLLLGLVLLIALMMIFFLSVRPQVFTWTLFASFFFILAHHERTDGRLLYFLPVAMALWANLHLGFVYGLMLVGLWAASRVVRRLRGEQVDVVRPLALTVVCTCATLLNPYGWETWLYPLRYLEDRESLSLVAEWRSPLQPISPFWAPYYLAFLLTAVALWKRKATLYTTMVAVCVLALSLTALRNAPFVAIMLLPVAGPALSASAPERARAQVPALVAAGAGLAFLAFAVIGAVSASGGWSTLGDAPDRQYPKDGAAWIAENAPSARLYNEYTWGGYLIEEIQDVPVFIDGRTDFYRAGIIDDYATIGRVDDGWDDVLREYGVDTVIVRERSSLAEALRESTGWEERMSGEVEAVFTRVD